MISLQAVLTTVFVLCALWCAWRKEFPGFIFLIGVAAIVAFAS